MKRRPPRSTRTDTLFPYTTLFRSQQTNGKNGRLFRRQTSPCHVLAIFGPALEKALQLFQCHAYTTLTGAVAQLGERIVRKIGRASLGKECVSTCKSRWSPYP